MKPQYEDIREQQKALWNKFSPGWDKWNDQMMEFLKPMGDEIIRLLNPADASVVLDIAAGTGEPGLTIAGMMKGGKVIITDLSEGMLYVARNRAMKRGINNIETKACDVSELPFTNNTFDAISCRFGFMFFPDMLIAAKEMVRVLKPGGKIATSVWNVPDKNYWVTTIGGTINRNMQLPVAAPEAPGIFRCAESGFIRDLFSQAGLKNTFEKEITGTLKCGSADVYWNMITETAAPFVEALSKADIALREKIKGEVYQVINQKYPDGLIYVLHSASLLSSLLQYQQVTYKIF